MSSDLRTISSKALMGFGALLSLAIVVSAFIMAKTAQNVAASRESITVKGLAEKPVKADSASWKITIRANALTAADAYAQLRADKPKLLAFLKEQKFTNEQILENPEVANEVYESEKDANDNYKQVFKGFLAQQTFIASTEDVMQMDQAVRQAYKLNESGLKLTINRPDYLVSHLEEIKMSLISDATKNAFDRALEFAKTGNAKVGVMKAATQGAFYILPPGGSENDDYYGGVYDKTTIDKVARVVVTIDYSIEQ
ncbi:SIMPL domain-containing protein [Neisseria sp. Ec49-e6-T10]|uniref:SIMPL domain-containing protein n=1 Tax=Neisseria sp. Ec49-e6-T10 TaxID=3140744 RepID=UPI003EBDE27A